MRLRPVLLTFITIMLLGLGQGRAAAAANSDLAATISGKNPLSPSLQLKNISDRACQVATISQGTVAVTKVTQAGKDIQPLPIDSSGDDDIGYLLNGHLKTLQPGQTVSLPLTVYNFPSGHVLRATTWSSDAGAFSSEYPISAKGALRLDVSYSLPITPTSGAPACGPVFATGTASQLPWQQLTAGLAAIIILAVVVFLVARWLWRRRKTRPGHTAGAASVLLLLVGGALLLARAPLAYADVVVPPELQTTYNDCISVFNANSDITGPVLNILNDPANHFEIVHTYGVGSDMTGRQQPSGTGGIFRIYWNPDDHHRYAGTGGSPDACSVLYHELYHALDQLKGTFSRDDCAGSGIETKEVMATRAQNLLRERLGLPQRSHYGDRPLPAGDCRAPVRPTSCTGTRCAESNGDPHLYTFDGLRYDFQGAGEFVAARSQSGDLEAQVRQEPWATSKLVAINTAVALKVGSDKVEIRAGQSLTLLINGKQHSLAASTLPGGGNLDYQQQTVIVTWPDGSVAYVQSVGMYGVSLSMQLAEARSGKVVGLLGNADGSAKDDLRPQGSQTAIQPKFEQLYPKYADSWRITDKSSLFTYTAGKHTASYTNRSFPDKPQNPKTLPGYAAAEVFCKNLGISDPAVLANCALDMAITGRPEFARAAARSQSFTAGADFGGTTWQLDIKNPGDSARVTFDAKAGEKVFVQIPRSTLPSQCGTLRLLGPSQQEVASGCIINGQGDIDGVVLPDAGTYTLVLAPDGPTGTATARLLRIKDKQAAITPDGPAVMAKIDQPGVISRYTFSGQAGQRVYVDIPSSTLDSQCGVIRLLDSDNQEVASGCIINHVGYLDTVVLPATGNYSIVIDPDGTTIGQAQLRLIAPTAETKSISMNGPSVTVDLKKPGSIGRLTFNGTAGQRVFVDLPTSELPSQCGILLLRAPDDSTIGNGCVINHKGNLADDGVVLPANGAYTIILDPNAADTGSTTMQLRSH